MGDFLHLDEVVVHGATVRLEAVSHHNFLLIIDRDDGLQLRLDVADAQNLRVDNPAKFDVKLTPRARTECAHEWRTRDDRLHRCDLNTHTKYHVCECGLRTPMKETP